MGAGHISLTLALSWHTRKGVEAALLLSFAYRLNSPACQSTGSTLVCCRGEEPCLLSCALQLVRERASSPPPPPPPQVVRDERREGIFPHPCHHTADEGKSVIRISCPHPQCLLTCTPANRFRFIVLPRLDAGSALPSAAVSRGNASSPTLMTSGSTLLSTTGSKG